MPLDSESARWVGSIGDDLCSKLAAVGRVESRQSARAADTSLKRSLDHCRERRADVADATNTNYGIVAKRMPAFFSPDRPLRSITEGETDRWLV